MMLGTADEMGGRSGLVVGREVDDPKTIRCDLLTHEDAANLTPAGTSQTFAKPSPLVNWKTDRDHRTP